MLKKIHTQGTNLNDKHTMEKKDLQVLHQQAANLKC